MAKSKQQQQPAPPSTTEKQSPAMLDPSDPTLYPAQSGDELTEIINYATYQVEKFGNYSTLRSVTYPELADCYVLIMRLAAHVRTLEGPQ